MSAELRKLLTDAGVMLTPERFDALVGQVEAWHRETPNDVPRNSWPIKCATCGDDLSSLVIFGPHENFAGLVHIKCGGKAFAEDEAAPQPNPASDGGQPAPSPLAANTAPAGAGEAGTYTLHAKVQSGEAGMPSPGPEEQAHAKASGGPDTHTASVRSQLVDCSLGEQREASASPKGCDMASHADGERADGSVAGSSPAAGTTHTASTAASPARGATAASREYAEAAGSTPAARGVSNAAGHRWLSDGHGGKLCVDCCESWPSPGPCPAAKNTAEPVAGPSGQGVTMSNDGFSAEPATATAPSPGVVTPVLNTAERRPAQSGEGGALVNTDQASPPASTPAAASAIERMFRTWERWSPLSAADEAVRADDRSLLASARAELAALLKRAEEAEQVVSLALYPDTCSCGAIPALAAFQMPVGTPTRYAWSCSVCGRVYDGNGDIAGVTGVPHPTFSRRAVSVEELERSIDKAQRFASWSMSFNTLVADICALIAAARGNAKESK